MLIIKKITMPIPVNLFNKNNKNNKIRYNLIKIQINCNNRLEKKQDISIL